MSQMMHNIATPSDIMTTMHTHLRTPLRLLSSVPLLLALVLPVLLNGCDRTVDKQLAE